jgi:dihydrodipicolinate reductase
MFIHIGGTGGMARAIADECRSQAVEYAFWDGLPDTCRRDDVAIHVGRKERLIELLEWCGRTGCPLIHAASGLDALLPDAPTFTIVRAPNLSLNVIEFMEMIRQSNLKAHKRGADTQIVVSHQLSKTTPPGTAHAIAELLGIPSSAISQLRSREAQRAFGVPPEHLERHSHHHLEFRSASCKMELSIRVNGLQEYADGALAIATALDKNRTRLESGIFTPSYILGLDEKQTVPG